jgi:transcriptional regulator with XRE-family HTH domain
MKRKPVHPIRRIRQAQGVTQVQLAEAANVQVSTISMIEAGKQTPRIETLRKLADALEVPWQDLVNGRQEP